MDTIKLSNEDVNAMKQFVAMRDAHIKQAELTEKQILQEVKDGRWKCYDRGYEDNSHLRLDVYFDGDLIFYGTYGIRENWVSLSSTDEYEGFEDITDFVSQLIEDRKITIEYN
jgi:hypothetical protein